MPPFPAALPAHPRRATIIAVIVTYDRPALLRRCLAALQAQQRAPQGIIVVDDASPGSATADVIAAFPGLRHLRHATNQGGAAAYTTGIEAALAAGADLVWLMDDDAEPADDRCLGRLEQVAAGGVAIAAPLVLDHEDPARLAFPIRIRGRTRFTVAELEGIEQVKDFAHLFNGALMSAGLFAAIGLPDPRFVCRGDEVEFMLRAVRAGMDVRTDTTARVLHPSSRAEINPILFGTFYAAVPQSQAKRRHQFRNRGYIFRAYGMWNFLLADIIRYGCHFLVRRRPDLRGFGAWFAATAAGWGGRFLHAPLPDRRLAEPQPARPALQVLPGRDRAA